MSAPTKDQAVQAVCDELAALLVTLRINVAALNAILDPPADTHGKEEPRDGQPA